MRFRVLRRYIVPFGVVALFLTACATSPHGRNSVPDPAGSNAAKSDRPGSSDVDAKTVEAHAHYALGTIYELDEQQDLALEEYSKAALADPGNEQLVMDLSVRYLRRKEPEKAVELLARATALPDASGEEFAELGLAQSRLGKDKEALESSEAAVKRAPLSLSGYRNLFLINLQKGRAAQSLAALDRAAKQPGTTPEFLVAVAEFYTTLATQAPSQKDAARAGAVEVLHRAAKANPANPQLQLRLADNLNLSGDSTNAIKTYLQLLDQYGQLPSLREEVRAKLAELYLRGNDAQKAKEQLEGILRDDPANATAYYFLGALAYDAKNLPEAEDDFRKSLLLKDDSAQVYYELAEVQINLDHVKAALATLDQARKKFQENFMGEFLTAMAYSRDKDFTNAVNHFTAAELQAKASDPPRQLDKIFYFQVGAAHERKGDLNEAEKYFDKALKLEPEYPEALNYLGYMLAEHGQKLDHAREMIEKAVKLSPTNAAYLDSLGWVLYKMNEPGDALPQELKAVELSEEPDATLFDHLGDIYAALKQTDKARESWQKSLALEPNEDIRKKLGSEAGTVESNSTAKPGALKQ
jgi:tetratricopeptide (TPR) repeat protein